MADKMTEDGLDDSPWRFICFAIVTEDNLKGEDIIKFWSPDLLPYEEGMVNDNEEEETQTLVDFSGAPKKVTATRRSKTSARWRCTVDGRQTPPNVTNGETIEIYQYGHEHTYYWVSHGRQPELRRLEHVVHAYSNLAEGREGFNATSSYGNTYSTREKFVNMWTSMSDGERHAYQLYFDTQDSRAAFHDNEGNILYIDSTAQEIHIRNAAGSYVQVIGNEVNILAATVRVPGTLLVTSIVADSIKANSIIAELTNIPAGSAPSLPGLPFTPFMKVGEPSEGQGLDGEDKEEDTPSLARMMSGVSEAIGAEYMGTEVPEAIRDKFMEIEKRLQFLEERVGRSGN